MPPLSSRQKVLQRTVQTSSETSHGKCATRHDNGIPNKNRSQARGAVAATEAEPRLHRLPTCALAAQQHNPQYKMIMWALEAGADLLPPSEAMEMRSRVLERPTEIDVLLDYAEKCIKLSCEIKAVYKSFTSGNVEPEAERVKIMGKRMGDNALSTSRNPFAQLGSIRGFGNGDQFDEFSGGEGDTADEGEDEGRGTKVPRFTLAPPYRLLLTSSSQNDGLKTLNRIKSSRQIYNEMQRRGSSRQKRGEAVAKKEEEYCEDEEQQLDSENSRVTISLRQHRELVRISQLALIKLANYVEEGPGYLLPLYVHHHHQRSLVTVGTLLTARCAPTNSFGGSERIKIVSCSRVKGTFTTVENRGGEEGLDDDDENTNNNNNNADGIDLSRGAFIHSRTSLLRATMASASRKKDELLQQHHQKLIDEITNAATTVLRTSASDKKKKAVNKKRENNEESLQKLTLSTAAVSDRAAFANKSGGLILPETSASSTAAAACSPWEPFHAVSGIYSIPSLVTIQRDLTLFLKRKTSRRALRLQARGQASGEDGSAEKDEEEKDEGDDDNEEEADATFRIRDFVYCPENYDTPSEDGSDLITGPSLEVTFDESRAILTVKLRLADAQMRSLMSEMNEREDQKRRLLQGNDEERVDTTVKPSTVFSPSTFLFQTEFIGIAADVWLGHRGPWRGKVLHVVRRRAFVREPAKKDAGEQQNGSRGGDVPCSTLVDPPYLTTLARVLEDRAGGGASSPSPSLSSSCSAPSVIDSIIVGRWVFARQEARPGGSRDDPYRCVGCGNTRLGANEAYACGEAPSGMRRGRYYCPNCRRATVHVNALLATDDPLLATAVSNRGNGVAARSQWNRAVYSAPSQHKDAVEHLANPFREPLHSRKINKKLNTMMGLQLI